MCMQTCGCMTVCLDDCLRELLTSHDSTGMHLLVDQLSFLKLSTFSGHVLGFNSVVSMIVGVEIQKYII